MAISISLPHGAADWADLSGQLLGSLRRSRLLHPVHRPELTPEERAHRIAMERLTMERSASAVRASGWPR